MTQGHVLPGRIRLLWQALPALAVLVVVLLAAWVLNARNLDAIQQAQQVGRHARLQNEAAQAVLDALQDAETGQRGYLLALQPEYLKPYLSGRARLGPALDVLGGLAAGTRWLQPEVAALRQAASAKLVELDRTVQKADRGDLLGAVAELRAGAGLVEMQTARDIIGRIVARTGAERDAAAALFRARERDAVRGIAAAAVLGAGLLAFAVLFLLLSRDRAMRAGAALQLQTGRLAGTVEHLRDGIALFDSGGRLLLSNALMQANTGWPERLLAPGASLAELAAAAATWPGTPLAGLRPNAPLGAAETQVEGRILDVWHSPMPDGGQLLAITDITRRAQAEQVARQAQKMEAMGQLTGGVAHDFNNLLQVVSANLEMIAGRLGGEDWLQARLSAALSGVERAARLTRHLLAFARRQPLAPQAVDTRALLGGMEEMLRRTLGERVQIEMVLAGGLWPLQADPQQLESALLNLAINARDAMPNGGKLTIEASNAALDDAYAAANAEVTPGQYVVIAVTDTGIGMTQTQLSRALEPFYTTKPDGQGTGLGLPMVFGFAKQSNGHFKLYSEPGHGTTARLYVPRSHAEALMPAPAPEPAAPAAGELVLVVEDDPAVRAASVQAIQGFGYRVVEAANAASALALIDGGVRPDLVFTDVVMPGQPNAAEMARRMRAVLPDLAVVFTSGYTENSVVHNGKLDPGVILVSKPWRSAELSRRLQLALQAARNPARADRPLRVLLVEDEVLVRMTTADLLADLGYEVVEAGTASEAMAALERTPDVLLADVGLPDMDGIALAQQAMTRLPGLRVIVASGRDVRPGLGYVALHKPYDQAALRHALTEAAAAAAVGSEPR